MKVLITGAQGQVGRCLLASAPQDVTTVGLTRAQLDVGNADAVNQAVELHRPNLIINAAAYTAVDRAETEVDAARRVNAQGPRHLARAAGKHGARLLHISTDFVFDGRAGVPYAPDAPTAPLGVYGQTKLEGEQAVRELLPQASVVLRTAWVYAPHGANFLRTMLRVMAEKRQVRVVADQIGTPTAADSLAAVLWGLAQRPEVTGVHHFTDAGVASWYDFAMAIFEEATLMGLLPPGVRVTPIATTDYPTPARRPAYSVLDKRTLLAALPLEHQHWRVSLRRVLQGLQSPSC
ncbi:MAG TPA: dTDP-4-dehydrorhamnose reductase [Steroidobacteraceae bacterium]|nr:dTDP-4-dehydrorhamnose reductase [Steroidobacteraceae bacterium]